MIDTLFQDIRHAFTLLIKKPAFSIIAILGLMLGIGANTAIFSVVNALLIRPLPYKDAGRLVDLWSDNTSDLKAPHAISYPNFVDWRDQNHVFEDMAAYTENDYNLTGLGEPQRLHGVQTTYNLFSVLGVNPILGRSFLPEENTHGARPVAILSFPIWQRRFGGDRGIIGRSIDLDGSSVEVVGVLPPGFSFSENAEVWSPLDMPYDPNRRLSLNLQGIGRLKETVSLAQARSEMAGIAARLAELYPATNKNWTVKLVPLQEDVVGEFRTALLVLLGAVVLVLLISCANVANLLLAQAASRQKEVAIRLAIGAARSRIVRQLLTESVILALAGGALGLLLALFGVKLLAGLSTNIPRAGEIAVDTRVLGFTIALSILTGLVFGMAPALQATRTDLTSSLKEGTRGASGGGVRHRLRAVLVVLEIAFALTLLIGAGLLIRSFRNLAGVGPGFDPKGVVTFDLQLPGTDKYKAPDQMASFYRQTLARIKSIPGVSAAAATASVPLTQNGSILLFYAEGQPHRGPEDYTAANANSVSPGYFDTMRIPILEGRDFTDIDKQGSDPVVIISETLARRYFASVDSAGRAAKNAAVGRRMKLGVRPDGRAPWMTIVGVAGDVKQMSLEQREGEAAMYMPSLQRPDNFSAFVVRASGDLASLAGGLKEAVQGIDSDQPIANIKTMDQTMIEYNAQRRLTMLMLGIFACLALLLASIGVYGVMAYSVTERTHEFGIRLALGAKRSAVLQMVVRQGMLLAAAGLGLGLGAAYGLTRLMSSLLFNVSATDPAVFAVVSVVLSLVALLACSIPAMRATRVDPMVTLRYE
jgi:putative ABC transport system permease protein